MSGARNPRTPKAAGVLERIARLEERIEGLIEGLPDAIALAVNNAVKEFITKDTHAALAAQVAILSGKVSDLEGWRNSITGAAGASAKWERWLQVAFPYILTGLVAYLWKTGGGQ